MKLKETLQRLLKEQDLTVAQLARKTGISNKTIHEWLLGRNPRDLNAVKKCAEALNVSFHYILWGEEEKNNLINNLLDKTEIHSGLYEITIKKVVANK